MSKKQKEEKPLFRKFRLVLADDTENNGVTQRDTTTLEKNLDNYDPTSRAIANLYSGMEDALFNRKVKRSDEDRLNLLAANRARIQYLNSRRLVSDNTSDSRFQPSKLKNNNNESLAESNSVTDANLSSVNKNGQNEESNKEAENDTQAEDEKTDISRLFVIPTNHKAKFEMLMDKISGVLGSNAKGEIVIRGKSVPNTSFADVMRALYVDSNFNIPGLSYVVEELKHLDVSPRLFTSRRARSMFSGSPSVSASKNKRSEKVKSQKRSSPRVLRLY